jgi:hypothetical protein
MFLAVVAVVALLAVGMPVSHVSAQDPAYNTDYLTAITYQNVGGADTTVEFTFYPSDGGSPVNISEPLAQNASASLVVSSVSGLASNFSGAAVLTSGEQIIATMVQLPQSTTVFNRPLSNGFSAGSGQVLIATVLKDRFNQTTIFSVQNTDTTNPAVVDIAFTPAPGQPGTAYTIENQNIPAGASYLVDAGQISQLGSSFSGSATITADSGEVVATALELGSNNILPYYGGSFEGVTQGGSPIYMPSALCNAFGGQQTFYAVQNNGAADEDVTVTYSYNGTTSTDTETIQPGAKASFAGCDGMPAGTSGSAIITGASASPDLVAVGKVSIPGSASLSTIFNGELQGANRLALPYVRWATDGAYTGANQSTGQRTFITIQNVGNDTVPANSITVDYVDPDGNVVGTHTISTALENGGKANSTVPDAGIANLPFGFPGGATGSGFGGGAVIECGAPNCQLIAIARVQQFDPARSTILIGEDYNGFQP